MGIHEKSREELLNEIEELKKNYDSLKATSEEDRISQKKTEEALRTSEERYNLAMEASHDGLFDWNLVTNSIYYSPAWKKMLGYEDDELPNDFSVWETTTLPADVEKSWELQQKLITGEVDRFVMEFKMKHKSGHWVDILSRAKAIFNNEGKAIRIVGTHKDISDRKKAEVKLRNEKEQIGNIVDMISDPIFVKDDQHRITISNKAFCEIFGLEKEKIIGFTLAEHVPENERDQFMVVDRKVLETGIIDIREETLTLEGNTKTIITSKKRFTDKSGNKFLVGSIHDITDRKQTEIDLIKAKELAEENEEKFKVYTQHSPIAIYTTNVKGDCIYANSKWLEYAGLSLEDSLGTGWTNALHPEDKDLVMKNWYKSVESNGEWSFEYRFITSEKKVTFVEGSAKPLFNKENKLIGYLGSNVDITSRKRAEDLLREKNEELVIAIEKAEESDQLKSAFLANMSHEIRTPMNSIIGFAELLKEPNLTGEKQDKYIQIITNSGGRMLNIIDDIVDISKIEAGLMSIENEVFDIKEQMEYIYSIFKTEAEGKGLSFYFENRLNSNEVYIKSDKEKILASLINLVKNAIKYTEGGYIKFGCEILNIDNVKKLQFFVEDSGIGIPKDRQAAIFERFVQADIKDSMARQGAGLGLAIAKSHIEMLDGEILMESLEGKGTSFYIRLPLNIVNGEY